jgi:radical SAM protein with 4Fe4S-binding SPASM domain
VAVLPYIPSFFIATSGDVYPCQGLALDDFRLGSVADSTMGELFDHPAFAGLRGTMTVDDLEVCGDCELRYVCARHCHADAVKRRGRTTAFVHDDVEACRSRVVTQLWLETRDLAPAGTDRR